MLLADFKTADALVLRLAQQGWNKTPDCNPDPLDPTAPFFSFCQWFSPIDEVIHQNISLYPQMCDHCSDLGISCEFDLAGGLFNWAMFECYAGSSKEIDPTTVEMNCFAIGNRLAVWEKSWRQMDESSR